MKKLILLLLTIGITIVMAVSLSACGGSDSDEPEYGSTGILGLWSEDPTFTSDEFTIMEFKKNGTGKITVYWDYKIEECADFKWKSSSDIISFDVNGHHESNKYILSGDKLILRSLSPSDDEMFDFTLYRVKAYPVFSK